MISRPLTADLIAHLCAQERRLLRRHGVRLRLEKITTDGQNAFCSVGQVRRPFFRSMLSVDELIALAHTALVSLHWVGLRPLISALPPGSKKTFAPTDKNDPFGFCHAIRDAGTEEVLLPGTQSVPTTLADLRREALNECRSVA